MELYDWLVSPKSVRGNLRDKQGAWISESAKPVAFKPDTRTVLLEDGTQYKLPLKTVCKAKEVHLRAEKVLKSLPLEYNGPRQEFQSADYFGQVLEDRQLPIKAAVVNA
jgi:hypothetical protein